METVKINGTTNDPDLDAGYVWGGLLNVPQASVPGSDRSRRCCRLLTNGSSRFDSVSTLAARWSCLAMFNGFSIMFISPPQAILASISQTVIAPNNPTRAPTPPEKRSAAALIPRPTRIGDRAHAAKHGKPGHIPHVGIRENVGRIH